MKKLLTICLLALVSLFSIAGGAEKKKTTVFMIGDSTMANKPTENDNQERGWGQMLSGFFSDDIIVDNHALNGRSSLSFILEGEWQKVYDKIQPGDYVFIQFGHNDEKIKSKNRGTRPGTPEPALCPDQWGTPASFDDNLRLFVNQTREKGGIPVLFNAIARRNFFENKNAAEEDDLFGKGTTQKQEGDTLIETHIIVRGDGTVDDYLEAPRRLAKEMDVPFVEMNAISKKVVEGMGVEGSKKLFCWIPANTNLAAPKGREDNTHLRIWGARQMCKATIDAIGEAVPALKPYIRKYDLVVAKDGSGDFFTVQEAINAVPDYNSQEMRILIQPGIYKEKLVIPESKTHVTLVAKTEGEVVITYDDFASRPSSITGRNLGTSGSASVYIYATDFEADGIVFENSASNESWAAEGRGVGQAVAVLVAGDRVIFRRCKFLGHQDTLYAYGRKSDPKTEAAKEEDKTAKQPKEQMSRQYYENCYIQGTVDYIFGWATAYFNRCELHSIGRGYVTAAATPQGQQYGYIFNNCKITTEPGVEVSLGRPWRLWAQVVYLNCQMEGVQPTGWTTWLKKESGLDGTTTARYAEYKSTDAKGKKLDVSKRVSWSRQLNKKEAEEFSIDKVLSGVDGWNPCK